LAKKSGRFSIAMRPYLVVDLTCGSASSAIGTLGVGKSRYFGCDAVAAMVRAARQRIADALKARR
jgi:predicted RNA methylase